MVGQRRQLVEAGDPETLEEVGRGLQQRGVPAGLRARLINQTTGDQGAHHAVTELVDSLDALEAWEVPGGYEIDPDASELDQKGGTVVLVTAPGWENRREARRKARADAEAERQARRSSDEEDDDE